MRDQREVLLSEARLRAAFEQRSSDAALLAAQSLIPVHRGSFVFEKAPTSEFVLHGSRDVPGSYGTIGEPSVVDEPTFFRQFESYTSGQLKFLDWSGIIVAGGAVATCLLPSAPGMPAPLEIRAGDSGLRNPMSAAYMQGDPASCYRDSTSSGDVDAFLVGLNEAQAAEKVLDVFKAMSSVGCAEVKAFITRNSISLNSGRGRPVNINRALYSCAAEVLLNFDLDCCGVSFNGFAVASLERSRRAFNTRNNVLRADLNSFAFRRMRKYQLRGFSCSLPKYVPRLAWTTEKRRNMLKVQKLAMLPERVTSRSHQSICHWDASGPLENSTLGNGPDGSYFTWKYGFTDESKISSNGRYPSRRCEILRWSFGCQTRDLVCSEKGSETQKFEFSNCDGNLEMIDPLPTGYQWEGSVLLDRLRQETWKRAEFADADRFSRITTLSGDMSEIKFWYCRHEESMRGPARRTTTMHLASFEINVTFSLDAFEIEVFGAHPPVNVVACCPFAVLDGFLDQDERAWRDKVDLRFRGTQLPSEGRVVIMLGTVDLAIGRPQARGVKRRITRKSSGTAGE